LAGPAPVRKYNSNGLILLGIQQRLANLGDRLRPEGVALVRPVDRDPGHAGGLVVEDVVVFFGGFPGRGHDSRLR
jgi:hypothetical protein